MRFPKDQPLHFVFTFEDARMMVYENGQYSDSHFLGAYRGWDKDDFGAWADGKLVFGRRGDGSDPWRGMLEGVAIYDRVLSRSEALQHKQLYAKEMDGRSNPDRVVVEAKLVDASTLPRVEDLGIYGRAMVSNEYEVVKVKTGSLDDQKVVVQQWAVMNRKPLPETRDWKVGETYELTLERVAEHPELEGERLFHDIENIEAEPWLEVTR